MPDRQYAVVPTAAAESDPSNYQHLRPRCEKSARRANPHTGQSKRTCAPKTDTPSGCGLAVPLPPAGAFPVVAPAFRVAGRHRRTSQSAHRGQRRPKPVRLQANRPPMRRRAKTRQPEETLGVGGLRRINQNVASATRSMRTKQDHPRCRL